MFFSHSLTTEENCDKKAIVTWPHSKKKESQHLLMIKLFLLQNQMLVRETVAG